MFNRKKAPMGLVALGVTTAIVQKTAVAPIDRVKLMLQNEGEMLKQGRITEPYKGIIDCAVKIYSTEGVLPYWRGNFANCVGHVSTIMIGFGFKDVIQRSFKTSKNEPYVVSFAKNIGAGAAGGALSLCFMYSFDYARTRLATDVKTAGNRSGERQFAGLIEVYSKTLKTDGFLGLYRGFFISVVGIAVYRGCYFGLYDSLKPLLLGDNAGYHAYFVLGFAVTVTSGLIAYPLDTVRRRMMMTSCYHIKYKSSWDCLTHIAHTEGPMALMKGAGASIISGIAGAVVLVVLDRFKKMYIH